MNGNYFSFGRHNAGLFAAKLRMRHTLIVGVICLFMGANSTRARSDGDIVYAARVYTRAGAGVSHWHLYRVNPNGSGNRQITSGKFDDDAPRWSPDGSRIAFVRSSPVGMVSQQQVVCLVNAGGGAVSSLYTLKKEDDLNTMQWSPDSKTLAVVTRSALILVDAGTKRRRVFAGKSGSAWSPDSRKLFLEDGGLLNVDSGKITASTAAVRFAFWLDGNSVCGLYTAQEDGKQFLRTLDTAGSEQKRIPIVEMGQDSYLSSRIDGLIPIPHDSQNVILKVDNSNSTVRPLYTMCRVNTTSGKLSALCAGQFLRFSPDGKQFCSAPGRDLGAYGKSEAGKPRTVWVAPLQIGYTTTGKLRTITPGTLWTTSADWRGAYPPR